MCDSYALKERTQPEYWQHQREKTPISCTVLKKSLTPPIWDSQGFSHCASACGRGSIPNLSRVLLVLSAVVAIGTFLMAVMTFRLARTASRQVKESILIRKKSWALKLIASAFLREDLEKEIEPTAGSIPESLAEGLMPPAPSNLQPHSFHQYRTSQRSPEILTLHLTYLCNTYCRAEHPHL